jgi:hypothetical protein
MRTPSVLAVVGLAAALSACSMTPPPPPPAAAPAAVPANITTVPITELKGVPSSAGESEMGRRGYSAVTSQGRTTYWGNTTAGSCVKVVTSERKFDEVDVVPPSFCRR